MTSSATPRAPVSAIAKELKDGIQQIKDARAEARKAAPKLLPPAQEEAVDMGEGATCIQCEKRLCSCPERQADKSWKAPVSLTEVEKRIQRIEKLINTPPEDVYGLGHEYCGDCTFLISLARFLQSHAESLAGALEKEPCAYCSNPHENGDVEHTQACLDKQETLAKYYSAFPLQK